MTEGRGGVPAVVVRRAGERFLTVGEGVRTWHAFSFGAHYDPANTSFGVLVAQNEEVLAPGGGYALHAHRDVELVTWVLSGELVHEDPAGRREVVRPGVVQRLSAGSGIRHGERAGPAGARFVQSWVLPAQTGGEPAYALLDAGPALSGGGLVPLVGGPGLALGRPDACLLAARLAPGSGVVVPGGAYVHVSVTSGQVVLEGAGALGTGDAARLTSAGELTATGGPAGAELLVWVMGSAAGGAQRS